MPFKRRKLTHIYPKGATFFITFRLEDALAQSMVRDLKKKMLQKVTSIIETNETAYTELVDEIKANYFKKHEHQLEDKPYGNCELKEKENTQILHDCILKNHNVLYEVKCFSIMPNHVHLLDRDIEIGTNSVIEAAQVDRWMKLIKGASSYMINKRLGRTGQLWSVESYDTYIRNEVHYSNSFYYTVNNAIKAGLDKKHNEAPYLWRCDQVD